MNTMPDCCPVCGGIGYKDGHICGGTMNNFGKAASIVFYPAETCPYCGKVLYIRNDGTAGMSAVCECGKHLRKWFIVGEEKEFPNGRWKEA